MQTEKFPHVLDGVTVPLVTPMAEGGRPSADNEALLRHMHRAGIDTIMLLGSNGEGAIIPSRDAAAFAEHTASLWRSIRGKSARVFVTVFGAGTSIALDNAESLMVARPDAVVVAPPLYFVHTEDELADHFQSFSGFGVPVIAYNIPRYSGNPITPSLLERLAAMDHIAGIKDSGGSDEFLLKALDVQNRLPRFGVSQGNEKRLGWALQQGARGITPGVGNLAPKLCVDLVEAVRRNDSARVEALQEMLTKLTAIHSVRPGVAAMKAALSLLGLVPATPGRPFRSYTAEEMEKLRAVLHDTDVNLDAGIPAAGGRT
ncbi:dihydrodipicolinate synthase family protein [Neorhizobium sp. DT-125]|uniref:dihydrodipicolinate synthase family protein n=1 Tax=Neorhizobium sp. DT-125 TaxID=3396163 RepID=UPI003F19E26E